MVAWASSPRKDHSPSEQRPHDGQDARRTMGCSDRDSGRTTERVTSALRQGDISTRRLGRYDMGGVWPAAASADSAGARYGDGHRTRPPVTGSVTDRAVSRHWDSRSTGLPSHSALIAPPLRLAALRWRVAFVVLVQSRPPPGVSTACLVAVKRCSGRPPGGSPCRACRSRAPLKENRLAFARRATGGCPAPVPRVPGVSHRRHARRCATSRAPRAT
jgi:hypothetical protein